MGLVLSVLLASSAPSNLAFRALAVLGDSGMPVATATPLTKRILLTNAHVVKGTDSIIIIIQCVEKVIPGVVMAVAPNFDLAIVNLEEPCEEAEPNDLAGSNLPVGQQVWVVGFPVGHFSVKSGIVSQYRGVQNPSDITIASGFTDAQIIPGNSGGPVIDSSGKLVGIVFGRLCVGFQDATTCEGVFIPASTIRKFVLATGKLKGFQKT